MILLLLLRLLIVCVCAAFIVTQILVPAAANRQLFPAFRKRTRRIEQQGVEARTREHEARESLTAAQVESSAAKAEQQACAHVHETYDEIIKRESQK